MTKPEVHSEDTVEEERFERVSGDTYIIFSQFVSREKFLDPAWYYLY